MQVGLGEAVVSVPLINASYREVDILGVRTNLYCTPLALDLVASGIWSYIVTCEFEKHRLNITVLCLILH